MIHQYVQEAIADRRYFHQHPELSGIEYETTAYIANRLQQLGIERLPFKEPGVVGYIKGTKGSKTIALRADIDALPVTEEADVDFSSKNEGVMHACGHDGHTAILLAVAKWLVEHREQVAPNVILIFQSAKEITPSGADALVRQGVLQNVDAIYGLHLWQGMEKGKIGLAHGPMMASIDDFEITIQGAGGHGSMPHETVDPIYIASHIIQGLQSIISRKLDAVDSAVISVGQIEAGTTYNIIPDRAKLIGTIRALSPNAVALAKREIVQISERMAEAFGGTASVEYIVGTPPLVNDVQCARRVQRVIEQTFGAAHFEEVKPVMGGEDFAYYTERAKGAFVFVGMGGEGSKYPHHHPKFTIDEEVIPNAIQFMVELVQSYEEEAE